MSTSTRVVVLLLAAPLVLATVAMVITGAVDRAGGRDRRPLNSAEAASLGDAAGVIRFMAFGDNPTHLYPVRPRFISSSVRYATTLEAATWARSPELIKLLDERGMIVGKSARLELACLASDLDLPQIVEYLGNGDAPACAPGAALRRITERAAGDAES